MVRSHEGSTSAIKLLATIGRQSTELRAPMTRFFTRIELTEQYRPDINTAMTHYVAFDGPRRIAGGPQLEIVHALRRAQADGAAGPLLAFDMDTGAEVDFDWRIADVDLAREPARGRGRPKLGVVAREVTLLPRHWEWLAEQRGGASAALRRLVDAARQADRGATEAARAKSAAYRFLSAIAGDRPHFEAAARALFADDLDAFRREVADWPSDIVDTALARLSQAAISNSGNQGDLSA